MSSIRNRLLGFASGIIAGLSFISAAASAEPVKVGILHSLTGTMAISEITLKDTILMLVDEQNKKGGVLGRPLEAVVVDPKSDWPTFATSAEKLLGEYKAAVVFGWSLTYASPGLVYAGAAVFVAVSTFLMATTPAVPIDRGVPGRTG